jgi:hypothetical protein
MSGIRVEGAVSNNLMEVGSDGSARVNLQAADNDIAGYAVAEGEITDGVVGVARLCRPLDVSPDYRLRVGVDTLLWQDVFNHGVFNTKRYIGVTSTQTITFSSGRMTFNGGSSVASAAVSRVQTLKTFNVLGTYPLYHDMWVGFSTTPQTNNVCEFGLGIATGTAAPTDGVFFRLNSSGELRGIVCNNSSETQTGVLATPTANQMDHYFIIVHNDRCEFWKEVNTTPYMLGYVDTPTGNSGPALSQALPLLYLQDYLIVLLSYLASDSLYRSIALFTNN